MCDCSSAVSNCTSGSNPAKRQVCSASSRFGRRSRQTVVLTVASVRPPAGRAVTPAPFAAPVLHSSTPPQSRLHRFFPRGHRSIREKALGISVVIFDTPLHEFPSSLPKFIQANDGCSLFPKGQRWPIPGKRKAGLDCRVDQSFSGRTEPLHPGEERQPPVRLGDEQREYFARGDCQPSGQARSLQPNRFS